MHSRTSRDKLGKEMQCFGTVTDFYKILTQYLAHLHLFHMYIIMQFSHTQSCYAYNEFEVAWQSLLFKEYYYEPVFVPTYNSRDNIKGLP